MNNLVVTQSLRYISFESRRAQEMQSLIERHGGIARVAPSMREVPYELNRDAVEFGRKVIAGEADVVILTTGVGTRYLVEEIARHYTKETFLAALGKLTLVVRGPKPLAVLRELGLAPEIKVAAPNTWKEIIDALDQWGSLEGKRVFVQEYGIQKPPLLAELKSRRALLTRVPVYRWALPEDVAPLRLAIRAICDGEADVLLFTNATQVDHLLQVAVEEGLEPSLREAIARVVVASIGPVASENLRAHRLPVDLQAQESKMGLFVKEAAESCGAILERKLASAGAEKWIVRPYAAQPYDATACAQSPFLKACRQEPVPYTPIWLMRQAGRYMKEYRDVRARVSFLELCKNSDLACEVTVTAQERLNVDAAIIFSDILLILEPMGVGLEYAKGEGPCIHRPVRSAADVDALLDPDPEHSLDFVYEAIRKTRSALKSNIPLIGFAGAPFTIVSYMIEGKGGTHYLHTKELMYRQPQAWHALMQKVAAATQRYIQAQIAAGAQAIQLFDSWVGCLSPDDYREYVQPHMHRLCSALPSSVPLIHFGTGTGSLLPHMREAGGSVIGLDWRVPLRTTWDSLGRVAVQGNLDPLVLLADRPTIQAKCEKILLEAAGRNGHIFNLGHGILPQTPVDNALALIDIVHNFQPPR